jgi:hypothetical protein
MANKKVRTKVRTVRETVMSAFPLFGEPEEQVATLFLAAGVTTNDVQKTLLRHVSYPSTSRIPRRETNSPSMLPSLRKLTGTMDWG